MLDIKIILTIMNTLFKHNNNEYFIETLSTFCWKVLIMSGAFMLLQWKKR